MSIARVDVESSPALLMNCHLYCLLTIICTADELSPALLTNYQQYC